MYKKKDNCNDSFSPIQGTKYMTSGHILFHEIEQHLMFDPLPSKYLISIQKLPEMNNYPFNLLSRMQFTKQSPKYHPEGSVWNHTLMVVDEAAKTKNKSTFPNAFMWAALLHDIGKPTTTKIKKEKISSYSHDQVGATLAQEFLSYFSKNDRMINQVYHLVLYHMQILYVTKKLPFVNIGEMRKNVDIYELSLLGLCDRLGRLGSNRKLEENNIRLFIKRCNENHWK